MQPSILVTLASGARPGESRIGVQVTGIADPRAVVVALLEAAKAVVGQFPPPDPPAIEVPTPEQQSQLLIAG